MSNAVNHDGRYPIKTSDFGHDDSLNRIIQLLPCETDRRPPQIHQGAPNGKAPRVIQEVLPMRDQVHKRDITHPVFSDEFKAFVNGVQNWHR